jgi:hypothetical protein
MSNQSGVDLLLSGEDTIAAIVNLANKTQHEAESLVIGAPRPSADENYNTDIEITFPIEPTALDPEPDPVTGEFHYNRLDLGRLFAHKNIRVRDGGVAHNNVHDLLIPLQAEARILIEASDIVDAPIGAGAYPKALILKATPTSLRFVGQFSIEILEPITDDDSFLVAPVVTENTTPSQAALKTDGTLVAGQNEIASAMIVASNGEIEVAGAARHSQFSQGIPAAEGVYHINVADRGDWSIPFSFLLLDKRNGDRITDLYDCTVKITAPGGGMLNFELKRQYGKLALVDTANNLTIDDPALYNDAQTLYQAIQRVTYYKNKLGSLDLNDVGAPYGIFEVEVKAVRKSGGAPVLVAYEVDVTGMPAQ